MNKNIQPTVFIEHIADALKRVAARAEPELRRTGWMAMLADEIGVSDQTVNNWIYGKNPPPGGVLVGLFAHLGDDFLNDVLSIIDRRAVPLTSAEVDATALKADIDSTIEKLTGVSCEIGRAIENGGGDKEKDAA